LAKNLIIAKKGEWKAQSGENAFHEKAGRSQVDSFCFSLLDKFSSSAESTTSVATLPSALWLSDSSLGAS